MEKIISQNSKNVIDNSEFLDNSFLDLQQSDAPKLIRKITINLTKERTLSNPYKITFPYKSIYIQHSTTSTDKINLITNANEETQDLIPLSLKDTLNFDMPIKGAVIINDAQPACFMTIVFILKASFRPGNTILATVKNSDGSNFETNAGVVVSNIGWTPIVAENVNRTVMNIVSDNLIMIRQIGGVNGFPFMGATNFTLRNTCGLEAQAIGANAFVQYSSEA